MMMNYLKLCLIPILLWVCPMDLLGQGTIIGHVQNELKEPIAGASVTLEGNSKISTVTDEKGFFELNATTGYLLVKYIGYQNQRVEIKNNQNYQIVLIPDNNVIDDVVVVGYGKQSKRNVTGAVSSLNSEDLVRTSSTTTAGALAGKIQGVSVRAKDARPGRGAALEIRNMGTPLYVIDGIAYGGETGTDWVGSPNVSGQDMFNSLNMEDIESISILKDAAAAVYGLRASSGVVLVTTKKGNRGDNTRINANGYFGWQNLTRFPKMASAAQYTSGLVEAQLNQAMIDNNTNPTLAYSKEELAKWQAGTEKGYQGYDYQDLIVRKNIPQRYLNANISGGSAKSNYYLSVGHLDQDAMMKDFTFKRNNIQLNLDATVFEGLTVGTQIFGIHEKSEDVGLPGGDGYFSSILAIFNHIPTMGPYANDNPNYINRTNNYAYNPALFSRDIAGYKDNLNRNINLNLYAQYKTKFGLSAKGTVSYNYTNNKFDGFQYTYDVYTYDETNDQYNKAGGSAAGWRYKTNREVVYRYANFQLDYTKLVGDHSFTGTLGYERYDYDKNYVGTGSNPTNNYIPTISLDEMNGYDEFWTYEARAGYIGRINYNYKSKYLVELLGRYDGSYLYAKDNRWGLFPGGSLGWRISEESFFSPLKTVVSDLKIRASIGQTGKEDGVNAFGYLDGYTWKSGSGVLDGTYQTGLRPNAPAVTNLSWVKNTNYNVGFDLSMFNNKLAVTADAFKIIRTGVPGQRNDVLLPSELGYSLPNENLGKNGYYGAEGIITYTNNIGELNYLVSGNITYSRYKSLESYKPRFSSGWDEYRNSSEERWGGIWWGYQVEGRFQSMEEISNYQVDVDGQGNRTLLPGDFIFKDVNGDGIINYLDERPIGYPNSWAPMLSFGGRIGLNWRQFDLNIDFSGGAMQSWFQNYELRNAFHGGGNSPAYMMEDRWHRVDPYDPNSEWVAGYYPALRNGTVGDSNSRNSDFWLTNVRYLRVRNLELGYSFAPDLLKKIKASKIRFYVSGSNLLSFDNVKKFQIDPEIQAEAAVVYPQQRTIIAGFSFTF